MGVTIIVNPDIASTKVFIYYQALRYSLFWYYFYFNKLFQPYFTCSITHNSNVKYFSLLIELNIFGCVFNFPLIKACSFFELDDSANGSSPNTFHGRISKILSFFVYIHQGRYIFKNYYFLSILTFKFVYFLARYCIFYSLTI